MKILMLTPYLPYPLLSGGQIRTFNLLKQLSDKHEITLFALIKDQTEKQYIKQLQPYCAKVKVFKRSQKPFTFSNILRTGFSSFPFLVMRNYVPQVTAAIKEELASQDYDLIHAETFYMMPHLPKTKTPTILVEQTIEYLGYQSYAKKALLPLRPILNLDIKKIIRWEKHYWNQADKLIVMSQDDKDFISQITRDPDKIDVVANGVDTSWFDEKETKLPDKPTLLYVGTFKWLPNIEAAQFLVEKVWPLVKQQLPEAQLKIVGNAPTAQIRAYGEMDEQIEVTGRVADIRDAFKQAHVLVAPVFSGKGTRYKILEAMACGTPIVASEIAVEGLGIENGVHALIDNRPEEMARLISKIINNKRTWQKLSKNGHKFVKQEYDWPLIAKKLDKFYQSMSTHN